MQIYAGEGQYQKPASKIILVYCLPGSRQAVKDIYCIPE